MKKSLLFCLAVAACVSPALAETKTPTIYPDASFQHISANGQIAVSELYGTITIYNLSTGEQTVFGPDYEAGIYTDYSLGSGNCVTADGSIILGSEGFDKGMYLQDGEWHEVDVPNPDKTNSLNGITPDGSRICGNVGTATMDDAYYEDVTMNAPAYWNRNADGKGYGTYNLLPAPKLDFFGRAPQYVKAIAISSDGKTIVGQITDARGMYQYPIVYLQDSDDNWSYILPTEKLFNPDKISMTEYPGESPNKPDPTEFMSGQRKIDYQTAYDNYDWPNPEDYMTDEEKSKYSEAMEEYDTAYEKWSQEWDAWNENYYLIVESSPNFITNNVFLSTDGKKVVTTITKEELSDTPGPWGMPIYININTPCSIDIASGELTAVDSEISCAVSGVADNDIILANNEVGSTPMIGYIIKNGEIQTIDEYINSVNHEYGEWIKKNMTHEMSIWDFENEEEIYVEYTFTGVPVVTPDLSVIAIWNDCSWDEFSFAESVVFDMSQTSGIASISADNKNLSFANGELIIPAGFASVDVFNASGACVKNVSGAEGSVKLNLANGVYIAKGTRVDGSVSVIKLSK